MRLIVVHNAYQQRGGEDSVVQDESALLTKYGHSVNLFTRRNEELDSIAWHTALRDTIWSVRTVREIRARIAEFRPDLIHVHNTFPLISPSIYNAAALEGLPVVQTLHNF